MKFFKRFVCIITVVAVLASIFVVSASAAVTSANKYPFDSPKVEHAFRYGWNRSLDVGHDYIKFSQFASKLSLIPSFQEYLTDIQMRYFDGGKFPYNRYFIVDKIAGFGTEYRFYIKGVDEFNSAHEPYTAYNGRMVVSRDAVMSWYDGTFVDFKTLSAFAHYLQANGFACTVQSMPYMMINGADDYSATVAWFITFEGALSGGWEGSRGEAYPWYILCDFEGRPIMSYHTPANYVDPNSSPSTNRPHYTVPSEPSDDGDDTVVETGPTSNQPLIYYDDDGQMYYWDLRNLMYVPIDTLNYDASQYLYYFDYRDQSTNVEVTVNITYNIDYTQVTYIGASEEYEAYKYYYELPDGRSSADMTAEDLEQLNLSYDVVNYGKSADDGRLRSLYHLDGNTDDSSYWVNDTSFTWNTNPSIEYLEATNFEGALYLDEQDHKFTLKLPSNLSASDFTLQFRYYHYGYGDTENNVASNYEDLVVQSTFSNVLNAYSTLFTNYAGTLTTNSTTPIGQWSEVAVIRDGAMLYTYVNGVVISSKAFIDGLGDQLVFDFKDVAVRRQIDEIRVFNYAMYEAGESYTPITVPMDTNLVLILPDEATPLPDGYWDFNTDGNLLSFYDYSLGVSNIQNMSRQINGTAYYTYFPFGGELSLSAPNKFLYATANGTIPVVNSEFLHLPAVPNIPSDALTAYDNAGVYYSSSYGWYLEVPYGATMGYAVQLFAGKPSVYDTPGANPFGLKSLTEYTFSLTFFDGVSYSCTFTTPDFSSSVSSSSPDVAGIDNVVEFDWGYLALNSSRDYQTGARFTFALIIPKIAVDLVYMELKEGDTPNDQSDAYKTVIYNEDEIEPNTIAVRTTVPVRSWRIGGVRPTLPYKGDVWMMIQDSRITSCQIYNGYMWVEVDCRIWTGERWAWPNYFNILTQQDMTDIVGTTDNVYIQDTEGYYSWITEQWKQLLDILNTMSDQLSNIDGGGDTDFNFDFNFDGTISVEFNTSIEKGRNSMYEILQFFWDGTFLPAIDGLGGDLESLGTILNPSGGSITVGGETVESPMGLIGKEYDWTV